jgi:hypothetical protein
MPALRHRKRWSRVDRPSFPVAATGAVGVIALLVIMLGWFGLVIAALGATTVLGAYRRWIQPWQHRWGATDEEVRRTMPGDGLLPDAASTTRAIGIAAPAERVWPWLVQLGYGRAGWYSYDWIDNDGQPSADRIIPELQQLQVGDQILMLPQMGPRIREVEPNRHLVAGDREAGVWCLALYPAASGCRLVSHWRVNWPLTRGPPSGSSSATRAPSSWNARCSRASDPGRRPWSRTGSSACCRATAREPLLEPCHLLPPGAVRSKEVPGGARVCARHARGAGRPRAGKREAAGES